MEEIWKNIPNYEGLYQISDCGRIKTLEKLVKSGLKNNSFVKRKERIIKNQINKLGYHHVTLYKNGIGQNFNVHKLVAESFIDKNTFKYMPNENKNSIDLNKLVINHKDENPSNNHVENLEWCTQAYNINYGHRNEKVAKNMVEHNRYATPVIQYTLDGYIIKKWRSLKEIEKTIGYSRNSIALCCKGKYKKSHGYIWRYYETDNERYDKNIQDKGIRV